MSILINRQLAAKALAEGNPLYTVADRGTGKTTGSILRALSFAMANPGTPVIPNDPDLGGNRALTYRKRAAEAWQARAYAIIAAIGLKDIAVSIDHDGSVSVTSTFAEVLG